MSNSIEVVATSQDRRTASHQADRSFLAMRAADSTSEAAVAGAVSGGVTRIIAAPLDLIKIRFQVQQTPISADGGSKYHGLLQSIRSIHAEEGLRSFWRGNIAATSLWMTYSAIQFSVYRHLQTLWPGHYVANHETTVTMTNGAVAGVVTTAITYPLDLCRTIMASQGLPKKYPTMRSFVLHTWATSGPRGFYSGASSTLFQIAPYMGITFGLYTTLQKTSALASSDKQEHRSVVAQAFGFISSGAISGVSAKLIMYPLDTIKKRMQMRGVQRPESYGTIPHYRSAYACGRDIVNKEGMRGLYKGTTASILKSAVTASATFASYELSLSLLQKMTRNE